MRMMTEVINTSQLWLSYRHGTRLKFHQVLKASRLPRHDFLCTETYRVSFVRCNTEHVLERRWLECLYISVTSINFAYVAKDTYVVLTVRHCAVKWRLCGCTAQFSFFNESPTRNHILLLSSCSWSCGKECGQFPTFQMLSPYTVHTNYWRGFQCWRGFKSGFIISSSLGCIANATRLAFLLQPLKWRTLLWNLSLHMYKYVLNTRLILRAHFPGWF